MYRCSAVQNYCSTIALLIFHDKQLCACWSWTVFLNPCLPNSNHFPDWLQPDCYIKFSEVLCINAHQHNQDCQEMCCGIWRQDVSSRYFQRWRLRACLSNSDQFVLSTALVSSTSDQKLPTRSKYVPCQSHSTRYIRLPLRQRRQSVNLVLIHPTNGELLQLPDNQRLTGKYNSQCFKRV